MAGLGAIDTSKSACASEDTGGWEECIELAHRVNSAIALMGASSLIKFCKYTKGQPDNRIKKVVL